MTAPAGRVPQQTASPVALLRPVPGPSPIHDPWAGTKLIAVFVISVLLTFYPDWVVLAIPSALILVMTARLARVPVRAPPSIPLWFWALMASAVSPRPSAAERRRSTLGGWHVGLGGRPRLPADHACGAGAPRRLGALVSWTTNTADIAPALAKLGRPLKPTTHRRLGGHRALALRSFPMLLDEFRVPLAARLAAARRMCRAIRAGAGRTNWST